MTQSETAEHLGISRPALAKIERGRVSITVARLEQLAQLYDLGASELLA